LDFINRIIQVGFASCLGKANETKGIESTYWMLGFYLLKYKHAFAV
jgi:hypothetical protein